MKSTFSRTFSTIVITLVAAFLAIGISFQLLVKDYLTDNTFSSLRADAEVISNLATAYSIEGSLSGKNFILNLNIFLIKNLLLNMLEKFLKCFRY